MRASVLWTGGKDSCLALHEAVKQGYSIVNLVTFTPREGKFLAHPIDFMKYQAEAMGFPHLTVEIGEPFRESYETAIRRLKDQLGVNTLVTGDIAEVGGLPNWIRECSRPSQVEVVTPLWGMDRSRLLRRLFSDGFRIILSCVKQPWFTEEWAGRELNEESQKELMKLHDQTGLDICGEKGEYHSLVIDGPLFKKRVKIREFSRRRQDTLMYLDIIKVELQEKPNLG